MAYEQAIVGHDVKQSMSHHAADYAKFFTSEDSDLLLSPVHGDYHGFPQAILNTGTRNLLRGNAVHVPTASCAKRTLLADLYVYEGW